ncbi:hypothetical protein EDC39_11260 [Geothermobacter ehrlichii]|uniref:Uncharacterized protein n=1 Tax=Geothermobacter ehrlichii TaxID=213224 RepID=A0A5D3WHH2_9BACT|nr:hypothetical protein [Geothermobacter ehrlichii]TYO96772.1 hypothetical protein EDC39_11260 [Geothermobacter ehrlichii]
MQQPVNQRQLSWLSSENILKAERFLDFADQMQEISDFGPIHNQSITFSGGVLPIQLTGDPNQVRNEFEQITDKRFTTVNFRAVFPSSNNLTVTVTSNLSFGHVNVTIQNGTDELAEKLFLLALEAFPRSTGPSDQEIEQQSLRLSALIKEAEKAVSASKKAQKSSDSAEQHEQNANNFLKIIQSAKTESEKLLNELKMLSEESSQKATEITNFKNQSQTNRDASQKLRDDIGAIEAKIREFFNEIEATKNTINESRNLADTTVKYCKEETKKIITKNQELQAETKEHLLKAVGASLFSAFEKRKKRIEFSKWVWALLTTAAIVAQAVVIIWIAEHVQTLQSDIPFYKAPSFLLRVTVSIPIIFFIGYSIHQYAREREYEELYGFKSSLSFSLSPYLDLVRKLKEESADSNGEHRQFVIETIRQIFENPLPSRVETSKKGASDSNILKDLLDRVIKIIEKGRQN